ncbi:MAG: hypothetical protein IH805_04165 [Proteobacteria bacterium]|nr:hypothetical protein [Pseudomonadota bacterium]
MINVSAPVAPSSSVTVSVTVTVPGTGGSGFVATAVIVGALVRVLPHQPAAQKTGELVDELAREAIGEKALQRCADAVPHPLEIDPRGHFPVSGG